MGRRIKSRGLVAGLIRSNRAAVRASRVAAARAPRQTAAQRRHERAVRAELVRMGVADRAGDVAEALARQDVVEAFAAARAAHGSYVGAQGYEELRETLLGVLRYKGVDVAGVTVRFTWDPAARDLGVEIVADPAAQRQAEAAVSGAP